MSLENLVLLSVSVGTQGRAEGKGRSIGDKKEGMVPALEDLTSKQKRVTAIKKQ